MKSRVITMPQERCDHPGCGDTKDLSCPHGHWCIGHIQAHGRSAPACSKAWERAFTGVLVEVIESAIALRAEVFPLRFDLLDDVTELMEHMRERLRAGKFWTYFREKYEQAGAPYEPDKEGLLRWIRETYQVSDSAVH